MRFNDFKVIAENDQSLQDKIERLRKMPAHKDKDEETLRRMAASWRTREADPKAKPKQPKLKPPVRSYHDDLDDKRYGEVDEGKDPCWKGYKQIGMKKKGGKKVPNCVPKESVAEGTGVTDYNPKSQGGTRKELIAKYHKTKNPKDAEAARKAGATQKELQGLSEDWQKVNKHDDTDGMSPKAVKAYRRENPGSKLKTAVTKKPSELKAGSKDAKRRKSFCARMSGVEGPMKDDKGRPTAKAKALSRWNCESIEGLEQALAEAALGTAPKRTARKGSRPDRGHEPQPRYKKKEQEVKEGVMSEIDLRIEDLLNDLAREHGSEYIASHLEAAARVVARKLGKEYHVDAEALLPSVRQKCNLQEHKKGVRAMKYTKKAKGPVNPLDPKLAKKAPGRKVIGPHKVKELEKDLKEAIELVEGAKVDRMKSHIEKSERKLGHSKDEAENIAWATLNKRGYLNNKNKKKKNVKENASHKNLGWYIVNKDDGEVRNGPYDSQVEANNILRKSKTTFNYVVAYGYHEDDSSEFHKVKHSSHSRNNEKIHDPDFNPTGDIIYETNAVCEFCGEHEQVLDENGKASRSLCLSSKPDGELGASQLASCKSQGLRAREGKKSHKIGKTRVTMGGKKIKGKKYGGNIPDWS